MLQIGSFVDGKYEVLKEIGRGGMSVVYLAMDRRLNKQWAIKVIEKSDDLENGSVQGLLREAWLMKKLDHPALPRIVDIIDDGNSIYIVMDYIEGESLEQVLKRLGPQPEEKVIGWARQLCDALIYLHGQMPPIIYRDMKPANIMLRPDGSLRIIDFGIAREFKDRDRKDTVILGTVGFAPPEQYLGKTDERSDIYALGMTLMQLLIGEPAEDATNGKGGPYGISEEMHCIIHRCIRQDPALRYQNARELFEDLLHPKRLTREYQRKIKRRKRLLEGLCLITLFSFLLAAGLFLTAGRLDRQNYAFLVETSAATDVSEKIKDYVKAISIYPGRADAYIKMLEAYETEGSFSKAESDEFLACYNAGLPEFDPADAGIRQLNFKAGLMYFNYYEAGDDTLDVSVRIQKAYPFFEANEQMSGENAESGEQELSHVYWLICLFYRNYIFDSASVEEASKDSYEELLTEAGDEMESLKEKENVSRYDLTMLYHSIFVFIFDQREDMASADVDEALPLRLMDRIYTAVEQLSVRKSRAKDLKREIEDNYSDYRAALLEAFS